ncbi:amidophosphoribosyltransferase [Wohlfahrtiimonas chitiniclastica]|uniref:amidophosphoribosyltransferase n=1 Tax=Wohlfahrtiimonas chitiniclastica TaxID=400946 RepID=UPI001BCEFFA8|nr:amidophosphoribosyltransferase [Wohlfahrtiimonas chitiniclastica]MBS7817768.1 amidophosphoribosyltransferase [Wohlfahrtiimonas chitiniclastica]MBS7833508.1 amidophosphoribosyltransferase [Wohlfahrtiimonas chitiniclastica]
MSMKQLNEECGVFAVSGNPEAATLTYYGLHALQHRGQESAGIATLTEDGKIICVKGEGLLTEVFADPKKLQSLVGATAIGHVRYPTNSSRGVINAHPIVLSTTDETIAIAFNGALTNSDELKVRLEKEGSVFHSSGETELLGHLLRRCTGTFLERLKQSLLQIEGAYSYTVLHDSGLYVARDPHGIRPLSMGQMPSGGYVFASETCAFDIVGAAFVRDVEPGEVITINNGEVISSFLDTERTHALCMMEYVYFSRPDSDLEGKNVHAVRKRSGIELFKEAHIDADIVIGVPDSSISAAIGYAEASGLPNEMGLIKNRYIGRTFIQPTQELRERGVRMKISAISSIVKDKRVILIDDSIVRGTTSKRIASLLRTAGAKEIHMRVSSPIFKYPCYYGVDATNPRELLAQHQKTVEDMRRYIDVDSLAFLSPEGLIKATGHSADRGENCGLCMGCFTNHYPTNIQFNEA